MILKKMKINFAIVSQIMQVFKIILIPIITRVIHIYYYSNQKILKITEFQKLANQTSLKY